MSGIIRNLLTLIQAMFSYGKLDPQAIVVCTFRVTPLDSGISILKSDKYLQFAEAAQLDYLVKTGLIGQLLIRRYQFVNMSMLVKFSRPIGIFTRVRVETNIVFADDKCAYFSHALFVSETRHAQVLVKMKFKHGTKTIRPCDLIGHFTSVKPRDIAALDDASAPGSRQNP